MRSPPIIVTSSDTAFYIAEKMIENNIGAVIVMKSGIPFGIITEKDIIKKIVLSQKDATKIKAQDIVSKPLIWIEADESVSNALKLMKKYCVRRLAVIKNGRLIGLVTERRLRYSHN
jgi:CBS domain-containing protein